MRFPDSSIYQCCSTCTAKWFGVQAVEVCPRCGAPTLEAVAAEQPSYSEPLANVDDSSQTPLAEAASLLSKIPAQQRRSVLVMAIKDTPPFPRSEIPQLARLLTGFRNNDEASNAVPILLQSPVRRTTEKLLEEAIDMPSAEALQTLLQHLEHRCNSQQLRVISGVNQRILRLLRHGSGSRGINVDPYGWASEESLLKAINKQALQLQLWRDWTSTDLLKQERLHGGQRIQVDSDRKRVRALYGHSLPDVCAGIQRLPPPALFHGASDAEFDSINRGGLLPMNRTMGHLTSDFDYAMLVASKRASPIVLKIDAAAASNAGVLFWRCNSHVWQCSFVPANFIHKFTCSDAQ